MEAWRGFVRTMAARHNTKPDELFGPVRFSVRADAEGKPAVVMQPAVRLEQATAPLGEGATAGARGYVDILVDEAGQEYRIGLTPNANLSTFLHETGHVMLDVLGALAAARDAPQALRDDYAALLQALGAPSREGIEEKHHELFARTSEAFFREGRAPSEALRRTFQRFKAWLHKVYPVAAPANVLSGEVQGVLGRLFATDEEIARARGAAGFRALFRTAEEARMSPEEFAALSASYEAVDEKAAQAVQARAHEAEVEAATEARQEEEAKASEEVGREYDARPDVRAARYLRDGVWLTQGEDGPVAGGGVGRARGPRAQSGAAHAGGEAGTSSPARPRAHQTGLGRAHRSPP